MKRRKKYLIPLFFLASLHVYSKPFYQKLQFSGSLYSGIHRNSSGNHKSNNFLKESMHLTRRLLRKVPVVLKSMWKNTLEVPEFTRMYELGTIYCNVY